MGNCWKKWGKMNYVVATQRLFFSPRNLEKMIQFDKRIFQMGWFNHQLGKSRLFQGRSTPLESRMIPYKMSGEMSGKCLTPGSFKGDEGPRLVKCCNLARYMDAF